MGLQTKLQIKNNILRERNHHYKAIFNNVNELLNAILLIHNNGKTIDCDPFYSSGNFYKKGITPPKYKFDLNNKQSGYNIQKSDARNLPLENESISSIIFDPPFFLKPTNSGSQHEKMMNRFGWFKNFKEAYNFFNEIAKEAYRVLEVGGLLIWKCQDWTENKSTWVHIQIQILAQKIGFYAADLAIFNNNLPTYPSRTQRHFRKAHTYFWVFYKDKRPPYNKK